MLYKYSVFSDTEEPRYELRLYTYSMTKKHTLIDLFSGAGGMTLGFADDRFHGAFSSVFAIDNDTPAVETYNQNFCPDSPHCVACDIEEWVSQNEIPKADVVIGGPPCQGFSLLNKNRNGDLRRALWEPYMDVVQQSGASVFVMENVEGLLKSAEFEDITRRAIELGFEMLSPAVLNMADYGVPQTRKRAIVIGVRISDFGRNILPDFPPPASHSVGGDGLSKKPWLTVRDAIGDLPVHTSGIEIDPKKIPPLDLHFGRTPTDVSKERYRAVPAGGNRFDLQKNRPDITPRCWIRKKSGGTDLFGRLWWNRPSVTIRTEFFKPEKGRYLHPDEHRPISHREAARLMTFPDDFMFSGTKIQVAKQIGNAVPPVFAHALATFVDELLGQRVVKKAKKKLTAKVA